MSVLTSIIIPTYNRAHLIGETLDSVIAQTYQNWECIVVDDGSIDYTAELLDFYCAKDTRIHYYTRPQDRLKGANACRNYGFEMSKGYYINWFDSDDVMDPHLLQEKIELLKSNSTYDYCLSSMRSFSVKEGRKQFFKTTNVRFKEVFRDYVMGKFSAGTPSILWKRGLLKNQDRLFDEKISNSQDLELYSRIFFSNKNIAVLQTPFIYFRTHEISISEEFFSYSGTHLNSYLEVRRRIINMADKDSGILTHTLLNILAVFRACLTNKNYAGCEKCLLFIEDHNNRNSQISKLSILRIRMLYFLFKLVGRGDTRFRRYLKIKV